LKLLLALDVGNTHCVVGFFEENELKHTWRISTHPQGTDDEFLFKLEMMLQSSGIRLAQLEAIVVSSVVPAYTRMLQSAFRSRKLFIIDSTWPFSFDIKPHPATQVGMDRLVNAEAVVRDYGFPSIIVDSGTATTMCAISKGAKDQPEYLGGAILAGIELSMHALAKNAAQLFTIELVPPQRAIGTNTQEALKSGILLGYASMIDGMVKRFKNEISNSSLKAGTTHTVPVIPVIATGGVSHLMKGIATELTHFDADLTLKGIAYLYDAVRKK
jgi:type III pantothenate kinase